VHALAFQDHALGRTILGPKENIEAIKRQDLFNYIKKHYTGPRIVLAASGGVNHDELVKMANASLGQLSGDNALEDFKHPTGFVGGEIKVRDDEIPNVTSVIAFESVGWSSPDYYAFLVIQTLMGSWDKTLGGGKNVGSKLAEKIAIENLGESLNTFNTAYHRTGLFGVHVVADPEHIEDLVYECLNEMQRITNAITASELERAKNRLISNLLMQLDGTAAVTEEIGRQTLLFDRRIPAAEVFRRIKSITLADISRVCHNYLHDTSPAVAAIGPVASFPDYNQIRSWTYWARV